MSRKIGKNNENRTIVCSNFEIFKRNQLKIITNARLTLHFRIKSDLRPFFLNLGWVGLSITRGGQKVTKPYDVTYGCSLTGCFVT